MSKLPRFLRKYFWDTDFEDIDKKTCSQSILARILEEGDERAVNWMLKNFNKEEIKEVLFQSRLVSPRSANFWAIVLGINRKKILCLQKPYLKIRRRLWPY
ncbi:MAG: hypothetical protein NC920_05635 [Candidatus Omnitrophica bacterium]|nr:hypothetical protein [Candidatus Omnitrophota bacterium]